MQNKRNVWIDNVKVLSCVLVTLGHLFQSMVKSGILPENDLYQWFNQSIYYFHVQLFFICSGYLHQKCSEVNSIQTWWRNVRKKAITLGIPYITFSTVTWLLKTVFSESVNGKMDGLLETLVLAPTAPYWFLYTLFFVFLLTPTFFNNKVMYLSVGIAVILKVLNLLGVSVGVYAIDSVFSYEVWFVLGMVIAKTEVDIKIQKKTGIVLGIILAGLFLVLSVCVYLGKISFVGISFFMGLLACMAVILIMVSAFQLSKQNKFFAYLIQYTMPIFLMHTIFAAPARIMLIKLGIQDAAIHIAVGLIASFAGPIAAAEIMKCFKWMNVFLYPGKYIKVNNGAKNHEKSAN